MLKKELGSAKNLRKTATASLRMALHNAAQLILMEKEKNKSPSCAMRISVQVSKVIWSMLADGKCFVEAEINDMVSVKSVIFGYFLSWTQPGYSGYDLLVC